MGKPLVFDFGNANLAFDPVKIDRSILYGFKEVEVLDERGQRCELATLADDGKTVVGRGGVTYAYLAPDGAWCDKGGLKPVDPEGHEIQPVPSSFAAPLPLVEKASLEEYLAHNVRSVYLMRGEGETSELAAELRGGTIFKFPYSFRGGLEADAGFLLAGADGNLYLAVATPTKIEFVGLPQAAGIAEEEGAEDEADMLDFDMI
jgi:hypothetical protein